MLSNAYFLAKFRFDTAENEPAKNLINFRKMHFRKMHFRKMHRCQRCVLDFDHHCGVFGRCIAGKCEFKGNMWAFRLILMMAASGAITCGAAVLSSFGNPRHSPATSRRSARPRLSARNWRGSAMNGSPYVPGSQPFPPAPPLSPT